MQFNHILVAFISNGMPPLVKMLKSGNKNYHFAPLAYGEFVYTSDNTLWSGVINADFDAFCPNCANIIRAIEFARNNNTYLLLALTCLTKFNPPGPSKSSLSLVRWSKIIDLYKDIQLMEVGFDVVDQWTGLSAIANIGYNTNELSMLKSSHLRVNKFGLFDVEEDATRFAAFAAAMASEHAPFVPLKVFVKSPSKEPLKNHA